ncbi:MAG: SDR family oxidoreductase, partial [Chloroflexota bacterium]
MDTVLVTGAGGYIGGRLVARLVEQGERPRCLIRSEGTSHNLPAGVETVIGDLRNLDSLVAATRGVSSVV